MFDIVRVHHGSSPLARGLRRTCTCCAHCTGIIPARAGFTCRTRQSSFPSWDHPRSRGVYSPCVTWGEWMDGSSPLARGLRELAFQPGGSPGIIPARAGFTDGLYLTPTERRDHPRSRGVYASFGASHAEDGGSSPLARGLPFRAEGDDGVVTDHPRSRGVYMSILADQRPASGSSPLARGLLDQIDHALVRAGIIPARAGFTHGVRFHCCTHWDHPRSRGVYMLLDLEENPLPGSSPLARGLRHGVRDDLNLTGIIPARAGFTRPYPRRNLTARDHPRSRGVYCTGLARRLRIRGSSPLARGLQHGSREV